MIIPHNLHNEALVLHTFKCKGNSRSITDLLSKDHLLLFPAVYQISPAPKSINFSLNNLSFFKILFICLHSRFLLVIYFIDISVYMSIPISQFIQTHTPTPAFPPWCPYVCSLHLCLYLCLANQFSCTIFLDSTYMR